MRLEAEAATAGLRPAAPARDSARGRLRRLDRRGPGAALMELRAVCALSRADEHLRGPRQHPLPAAALRVARDRFLVRRRGPGRAARPAGPRPDLHRRRPGPRPAHRRRGHGGHQARRASPRPSRTAPCCSPSAVATSSSATATSSATSGSRASALPTCETVREPGPRLIGNIEIEVDLGDGPSGAGRVREPRRAHLPRRRRRAPRPGGPRPRQQRPRTASRACGAGT